MKRLNNFLRCFVMMSICLMALLSSGCSDLAKGGLEGTYVNTAGSEFSEAKDTLVIRHVEGQAYMISRSTAFRLLDEQGKPGKWQHEREEWNAVWDAKTAVLTEQRHGKLIRLEKEGAELLVGKRRYKRIN